MIAPLAVTLALAFWAPYSPQPVCPDGVVIHVVADIHASAPVALPATAVAWTWIGGGCVLWVDRAVERWSIADQCAIVAHEIGHGALGLDHSADPANIMAPDVPTPAACVPPTTAVRASRRRAGHKHHHRHRLRAHPTSSGSPHGAHERGG